MSEISQAHLLTRCECQTLAIDLPHGSGPLSDGGIVFQVQTRKQHGKWTTRYTLKGAAQAEFYYRSMNTWGDYRKRLLGPDGEVLQRQEW